MTSTLTLNAGTGGGNGATECFRLQPRRPMVRMPTSSNCAAAPRGAIGLPRGRKRRSNLLHAQRSFAAANSIQEEQQQEQVDVPPAAQLNLDNQNSPQEDRPVKSVPVEMISFVPSSASASDTDSTRRTATTGQITSPSVSKITPAKAKDSFPTTTITNAQYRMSSTGAEDYLSHSDGKDSDDVVAQPWRYMDLSSPGGGNLDGATITFQGLALHSPSPSSARVPQFSHQEKSSPFSMSSRTPQRNFLPRGPSSGVGPASSSSFMNGGSSFFALTSTEGGPSSNSIAATTPPHKTAPLRIVTNAPGTTAKHQPTLTTVSFPTPPSAPRKRQPELHVTSSKILKSPKIQGQGTPKTEDVSFSGNLFHHGDNDPMAPSCSETPRSTGTWRSIQHDEGDVDELFACALQRTPLPSVSLLPRGGLGSQPSSRYSLSSATTTFGAERRQQQPSVPTHLLVKMAERSATEVAAKTHNWLQPSAGGADSPSDAKFLPAQEQKLPSSSKSLKQSDMSFIPLPEWNHDDHEGAQRRQHPKPQRRSFGAVSLLRQSKTSMPDPIDQIFGSLSSTHSISPDGHHRPVDDNQDIESLSDTASDLDCGFLLAAPRDIEDERQSESDRPTKTRCRRPDHHDSSQSSDKSSRVSASHPSVTNEGSEASDNVPPLPKLQNSSSASTVSTRDLITPPAMMHGSSPPPLMVTRPSNEQFH
ncbi:hypothetical protein ACA910_014635 [Epithemia clementina (nom. ined.)]